MRHNRSTPVTEHTITLTEAEAARLCVQLSELLGWGDGKYAGSPACELRDLLGRRNVV